MSSPTSHLFIYGTLLVPKIWNVVTGYPDAVQKPATLSGHCIARVKGGDFPVITEIEDANSIVSGAIRFDIPAVAIDRLDSYEDRFYQRDTVDVECDGRTVSAQTYRVPAPLIAELFSEDHWTLEWFEENALDHYWERHFGK